MNQPLPDNTSEEDAEFRADWLALSSTSLSRMYGDDKAEYDMSMMKK